MIFLSSDSDIQKCVGSRGKLETQLNENKTVKEVRKMTDFSRNTLMMQEMDVLEDGAIVYKLIGPVLVQQELAEARQTVEKRLDYINKEM